MSDCDQLAVVVVEDIHWADEARLNLAPLSPGAVQVLAAGERLPIFGADVP